MTVGMRGLSVSTIVAVLGAAALSAALLVACVHGPSQTIASAADAIPEHPDYNWDVRPILSQNCFSCHGAGVQKAGLRLDVAKVAFAEIPDDQGKHAIVPGNPKKSELIRRITSDDLDYRMPPKQTHKVLSPREVAILQRWIQQGAKYKEHWAYIPPKVVTPARSRWDDRAVNPIDRYVFARLEKEGLEPSPEADRETLINRVTLDLTGLPPSLAEVDAFVADKRPDAYERVVDRLLASRAYAERQTNVWLDVARYADSDGYLNDGEGRFQHPYRDWLITAFQRNMPYDQFVTWQLAGDKLPNPTREQILATAFTRAGKKSNEGGIIDEEYRVEYVNERAELVGKAFLGLTVGCAKCHDHKYDVISQADYYSMGGFFNSIDERGIHSAGGRATPMGPTLAWPTPKQARDQAAAYLAISAKQAQYQAVLDAARKADAARIDALMRAPVAQRAAFVKAAGDASLQAYYPLDTGYKASFEPLMIDPTPPFGAPPKEVAAGLRGGAPHRPPPGASAKLIKASFSPSGGPSAGPPGPHHGPPPGVRPGMTKPGGPGGATFGPPPGAGGARPGPGAGPAAGAPPPVDPDMPRVAGNEVNKALLDEVAKGLKVGNALAILKRQLMVGLKAEQLYWTPSGLPGGKPGFINNVTLVDGVKGKAVLLNDSVVGFDMGVGQFERTQPYTLDLWVKLRADKPYDEATIVYNTGAKGSSGYELMLRDNYLQYNIVHAAPYNMLSIESLRPLPRGQWIHLTSTYDGDSRADGMKLYVNGQPLPTQVLHDHLTGTAKARGGNSQLGSYYGLAFGKTFGRLELKGSALDEMRVFTRALTPIEVAYLHNPATLNTTAPDAVRAQLIDIAAAQDPKVAAAWEALRQAREAEQQVEAPIYQMMVLGDAPTPRKNYVLDHGVYNQYRQEVPTQALPRVFPWRADLPRDRLGLTQWLFDPKQPLTSRVYVNRMWQGHFGTGIVDTVEDFGTQGSNPTHPELLDWLAVEFIRSGWDIKHMHKLMVMSATYRQSSNITPVLRERDPGNRLLARGPRYRMPAEMIRDNALFASGLLVDKPGGDSVFPYQPPGVWDSTGVGVHIYPTDVPADQMHRRTMYTFMKRNALFPSLMVFDMADRNGSQVVRKISNTPLQALVLLNDTQYLEAYRKLAERALDATPDRDTQIVDMFRLVTRRRPSPVELAALKDYREAEIARLAKTPADAKKLIAVGVAPSDPKIDTIQLAAMTMVTAAVMNTPDAYSLR
jgi:hypothetical protein